MIYTQHIKTILLTLAVCFPFLGTMAQTTKEITVSQNNSYTDHLSLRDDSKDMDLMAKFVFNESNNTLSIYLISYRDIFVFQTDTPYKQAVRRKQIKPNKLPFVVDAEPGAKYKLGREYYESIPKPRKKHMFEKWVEYSGLTPIPAEYKMVNDFVQQDFTILNNADAVTLTLHDVMMVDQEESKKPTLKKRYNIVWGKDLNITYHIYIERNPCFGMEKDSIAAAKALESITAGYKNIANRFGSGVVNDRESLGNFKEMKQLLQGQFPFKKEKSPCPDIQDIWDSYNLYVDSINSMRCRIKTVVNTTPTNSGTKVAPAPVTPLNAGYILTQARRIDNAVSRWLTTKDSRERADLKRQCKDIIQLMKESLAQKAQTAEQRNAVKIFNEAVRYYNTICK